MEEQIIQINLNGKIYDTIYRCNKNKIKEVEIIADKDVNIKITTRDLRL